MIILASSTLGLNVVWLCSGDRRQEVHSCAALNLAGNGKLGFEIHQQGVQNLEKQREAIMNADCVLWT